MRRSTSAVRRACAAGTTIALVGLTTGLGIMTATAASAAPIAETVPTVTAPATTGSAGTTSDDTTSNGTASNGTTTTGSGAADGAPAADGVTSDAGDEAPTGGTDVEPQPNAGTPTVGGTDTEAPGTGHPGDATTAPATGTDDEQPRKSVRLAAVQSVVITGDLLVGSQLVAEPTGFTSGSKISYLWTDEAGRTLSESAAYTIEPALAGQRITVTLEGSVVGETARDTTDTAVAPVFVDEDGQPLSDDDSDPFIDATAGEAFSYTFRALSTPAPTLSITWFDEEDGDPTSAPAGSGSTRGPASCPAR
ncbi:hypothetical protein P9139_12020 [Curtobacterium flaccumfaciens]|nr:hypothetical protein P9139_12020 [Curtobacterium flaccumfaciens]